MRLAITQATIYRFDPAAARAIQTLRLTPRTTEAQLVDRWRIDVSQDCRLVPVEDAYGNLTHSFSIDGPIEELSIEASGEVVTEDTAGILHGTRERLPLAVFLRITEHTPLEAPVRDFAATALAESVGDRLAALHLMMGRISERLTFDPDAPATMPHDALAASTATAEDIAHLFAAAARSIDVPTRCVSGWRFDPDDPTAARLHAWNEAHLGPGLGWVGFDATRNECPTDRWVRLAVGLDALDTCPIRGVRTHFGAETVESRTELREISVA